MARSTASICQRFQRRQKRLCLSRPHEGSVDVPTVCTVMVDYVMTVPPRLHVITSSALIDGIYVAREG